MGAPMGMNAALNATVALIEGRTDIAKEIVRSPGSDVKNVPDIMARLDRAVNRAAAKALRNALVRTLAVTAPIWLNNSSDPEEIFYMGVNAVEKVLDDVVAELDDRSGIISSDGEELAKGTN